IGSSAAGATGGGEPGSARPVGGNFDPRAVEALTERTAGGGQGTAQAAAGRAGAAAQPGANPAGNLASGPTGQAAASASMVGTSATGGNLPLALGGLAGQFAQALSLAMQGSGLFYEAHLREFAFGQRTLEQLRAEPQAQAGRPTEGAGSQNAHTGRAADGTNQPAGASSGSSSTQSAATQAQAAQSAQVNPHLSGALLGMDPSTHMLVRQQLEVLANQAFIWQGEAWPGTEMEWEVQRRDPQGEAEETENW